MTEYNKGKYDAFREVYVYLHYEYKSGKKSKEQIIEDIKKYCFEHSEKETEK